MSVTVNETSKETIAVDAYAIITVSRVGTVALRATVILSVVTVLSATAMDSVVAKLASKARSVTSVASDIIV